MRVMASTIGSPWDGVVAAPVPFTSWGDATSTAMDCDGTQLAASEPVEEPWDRYMDERLSQEVRRVRRTRRTHHLCLRQNVFSRTSPARVLLRSTLT